MVKKKLSDLNATNTVEKIPECSVQNYSVRISSARSRSVMVLHTLGAKFEVGSIKGHCDENSRLAGQLTCRGANKLGKGR